jgi:diguanylate cyclase (GGDEF)-like protein
VRNEIGRVAVPGASSTNERISSLTVARTLKLASVLVLLAFVAFMFASYLSIETIDASFHDVVSIDQPSLDAAGDMDAAADEATIAFLESLVTNDRISSAGAWLAFNRSMRKYQNLVRGSTPDELSEKARDLFSRVNVLGLRLVADDERRNRLHTEVQDGFEAMDDSVEDVRYLAKFEGDIEENARMVSNYGVNPSPENKKESADEFEEFIHEIQVDLRKAARPEVIADLKSMLDNIRGFRDAQEEIASLTEREARTLPEFLSIRTELDQVLEEGIYERVQASLEQRNELAEGTVESSKAVLIGSLIAGVTLGLGALLWVRRRISQPVGRLMNLIARHGAADSSDEKDLGRADEFGVLARALSGAAKQRAELEAELRRQALEDPLTGLANRTLFKDRVEHALSLRREEGKSVAVAFLDLDDFKTINDSLGHAAGDELLIHVARRIKDSIRTSDTAARLGGDEFAVLLEDVEDISVPAYRILQSLAEPIDLEGKPVTVHGSVGIALHQPGQTASDLLRNADVAMYGAKAQGKGRFMPFDQTMHSAAVQRFELKNELLAAIEGGEFTLHYQPIMDLTTNRRTAVEALIRWEHPERGMINPGDFIPLAEETGAIVPIGRWVLDTACAQVATWRRSPSSRDLRLSVNVSPNQLKDGSIVEDVARSLARAGLPAEALVLEITESAFLLSHEEIAERVVELAALGVVIALDDFGSGYSSLGYLSKLPIGILKIDRSFVDGIDQGPEEAAVAQAIIRLGHTLGLEIIAEGIETSGQLAELRRRECHLGQGFLLGRPSAPERSGTLTVSVA